MKLLLCFKFCFFPTWLVRLKWIYMSKSFTKGDWYFLPRYLYIYHLGPFSFEIDVGMFKGGLEKEKSNFNVW